MIRFNIQLTTASDGWVSYKLQYNSLELKYWIFKFIAEFSKMLWNSRILRLKAGVELSYGIIHRLNMELDLQSLFGLLCTAVHIGWDPASPPHPSAFGLIHEGAIGQLRYRRHLFLTPCSYTTRTRSCSKQQCRSGIQEGPRENKKDFRVMNSWIFFHCRAAGFW